MKSVPSLGSVHFWAIRTLVLSVLGLAALSVAVLEYANFLEVHRSLWVYSTHDRNAHYLYALKLASALRDFDMYHFLDQVNRARVWPPFHGLLASLFLAGGGFDYRLAVLPSLLAWAACPILTVLIARRALPWGGTLAGMVAGIYLLVSPLHRAFATDIMLESLGACLTLAAVLAYLMAVQEGSRQAWRMLGVVLTILFLHKYNYWMISLIGLVLADVVGRFSVYRDLFSCICTSLDWRTVLRRESRQPLNYLLLLVLGLIGVILGRGDRPVEIAGRTLNVYPPENFISVAYVLFFLRLVSWWKATREFRGGVDESLRQLTVWHFWPVAIFFLMPKHLSAYLWYMGPGNIGPAIKATWLERVSFYAEHSLAHYHLTTWSAALAVLFFFVGLCCVQRFRPGTLAVFMVALVGALLTASHPNRQGRFLHSWIALMWLGGALGVVGLSSLLELAGWRRVALVTSTLASLVIVGLHIPGLTNPPHSREAGPVPVLPSLLDVTDSFSHELDVSRQATILATVPVKPLIHWTLLERQGRLDRLEDNWYGFASGAVGEPNRVAFQRWLSDTQCDTLIFIDRIPGVGIWEDIGETQYHQELRDLILEQTTFQAVKDIPFPRHGCRVVVMKKNHG